METDRQIVILVGEGITGNPADRIRAAAPGARVLTAEELGADPALAEEIDVCYGILPPPLWTRARRLAWLHLNFAGVETVLAAAGAHPAVITNTHIHAEAVAEHLWGMCLMLTRNLHRAAAAQMERHWDREALIGGLSSLSGRTLCVAGLGPIGRRCASLGKALGMNVIGIRRDPGSGKPPEVDEVVGPEGRRDAFSRSRIIMAVLPGTEATRRFIGKVEMVAMQGAYVLNAGRGSAVDTEALVDALRGGQVRGAGLDVADPEPLPADHALWGMSNVIISPHYAGDHPGYAERALQVFLENLGLYLRGVPLGGVVNRRQGY